MSTKKVIRTRFAPSPSGHLHVGGARTALYCWAYAKGQGGKFILRIEDTDQKRSSDKVSMAFLEDLKWLGIEWDEGPEFENCGGGEAGPYHQSQRLDLYAKYIEQLVAQGKAYPAFETTEEIDVARKKAREAKTNFQYDRAALKLDPVQVKQWIDEGKPHVIRFKVPDEGEIVVQDEVRGEVKVNATELDDFVIRKADGFPTYHFAVVVDDELMGVTHVIRAQEHLTNTHKHVLLQEGLGFSRPVFAHLSVILNPDGSKMSKRDKIKAVRKDLRDRIKSTEEMTNVISELSLRVSNKLDPLGLNPQIVYSGNKIVMQELISKEHPEKKNEFTTRQSVQKLLEEFATGKTDNFVPAYWFAGFLNTTLPQINVDEFRHAGYLPEVIINYLSLLGWSPGDDLEKFDAAFLCEKFNFDRVMKSPAKFDRDKLLAFNLDALQGMPPDEFVQRLREHCEAYHEDFLKKLSADQFDLLARANQARSKTLNDPVESCRFFVMPDTDIVYEKTKAVRKALCNGEPSGYEHLEAIRPILE
ncbi:MAG: glutamate--tRNA ligase, partial [Planctomycetota bacterium]|nr:glutamate--tRNA ligase [Planctomycetota bacterium]